jgi:3-isopropylmalate dehydrogenase
MLWTICCEQAACTCLRPQLPLTPPQAPDIAGQGIANPVGTILSAAMLCRYSLGETRAADAIEAAVRQVLDARADGGDEVRTRDLHGQAGSKDVGDAVCARLEKLL